MNKPIVSYRASKNCAKLNSFIENPVIKEEIIE